MVLNGNWKKSITFAALLTMGLFGVNNGAARADSPRQQYAAQNNAAPAATLQVTGTATRFSVAANHADVQDTLKTVFDQAGKQFILDNNITGQITLRLSEQPLNVVLEAICRQAFLRSKVDANTGIFSFERDDDALRLAFTRLRSLDSSLRDQMRLLGLSLPSENAFGMAAGSRGGAYGNLQNGNNGQNGNDLRNGLDEAMNASRRSGAPGAVERSTAKDGNTQGAGRVLQVAPQGPLAGQAVDGDKAALDTNGIADIQQFLQTNNFVSFHVPADKPEPVYSVLQSLGQQAKVMMLIDPNVPIGSKFTLRGSLSPRPLPEALNILAPYARLEWRWVGNTIFVQTAPDFALFYNDEKEPRARYAPQSNYRKMDGKTDAPAAPAQKPMEKAAPKSKP